MPALDARNDPSLAGRGFTLNPIDAWRFARILSGEGDDAQALTVHPDFLDMAHALLAVPVEKRHALLTELTAELEDGGEMLTAIFASDPHGPKPDTESEALAEWGELDLDGDTLPVEQFPLWVLPGSVRNLVVAAAAAIKCPVDYVATFCLVVISAAVGRSCSLFLNHNRFANAMLWATVVASPTRGKSPAQSYAVRPIHHIDDEKRKTFSEQLEAWKAQVAAAKKDEKHLPAKPILKRVMVSDITTEALLDRLAEPENERGVLANVDEMAGWVQSHNQYKSGGGSDTSTWLTIWNGDPVNRDRVGNGIDAIHRRVKNPLVSLMGGIVPDNLSLFLDAKKTRNGLIDRMLFCYPEPMPVNGEKPGAVTDETMARYAKVIHNLYARDLNVKEGNTCPHVVYFTPEADNEWWEEYKRLANEMNMPDFEPELESCFGKLREYAGRFVLPLVCAWDADRPDYDPDHIPKADESIAKAAWALFRYFASHARKVHYELSGGISADPMAASVMKWLRDKGRSSLTPTTFAERDLYRARKQLAKDKEKLSDLLALFQQRNVIRRVDTSRKGTKTLSPVWEINPKLFGWMPRGDGDSGDYGS